MVDFINYPTLSDYVAKNKDSLSYQTKIYLGYIIAQGLRYLQEYQIAHLDLKPSNIMLYKKMMIKLIDFGESYHPDVRLFFTQPEVGRGVEAALHQTGGEAGPLVGDHFFRGLVHEVRDA